MSWFPRYHTAEDVARRLIAGLEDGSLTLDEPTDETPVAVGTEASGTGSTAFPSPPDPSPVPVGEDKVPQLDTPARRG
jgi:hypothetical protein